MTIEERSLSALDVARILGVSRSFAYDLIKRMPHESLGSRCLRVRESVFAAWRSSTVREPGPEPFLPAAGSGDRRRMPVTTDGPIRLTFPRTKRGRAASKGT